MITIKHKDTGEVLFQDETASSFQGIDLDNLNLHGADLSGLDLSCASIRNGNLTEAVCRGTNFNGAMLTGAALMDCDCEEATFVGAQLNDCHLENTNFTHANLEKSHMRHCRANGCQFESANLNHCDCSFAEMRAELRHVSLQYANLFGVDFTKADLSFTDLRNSNMDSAKINGTTFYHCKMENCVTASGQVYRTRKNVEPERKWWQIWKPVA